MNRYRHSLLWCLSVLVATGAISTPVRGDSPTHDGLQIHLPIAQGGERLFKNDVSIVEPEFCAPLAHANATFVTYSDKHIQAWMPKSLTSLWQKPVECPYQPRFLLCSADQFVFATNYEIFAVARSDGRVAWRIAVTPGQSDADDLVDADRWVRFGASNDEIIAANSRSELICINADSGSRRWRVQLKGPAPRHIEAHGNTIFCIDTSNDATVLTCRDPRDGAVRSTFRLPASASAGPFFATPFGLALCSASSIVAYDGERRLWEYKLVSPVVRRSLTAGKNMAVWLDSAGHLTSLDLKSGWSRWSQDQEAVADAEWLVIASKRHVVIAGKPGLLVGIDSRDGALRWQHSGRAFAFAQPPTIVDDDLWVTYRMGGVTTAPSALPEGERLLIRRIDIRSGLAKVVGSPGDVRTDRVARFGGLYFRDDALILLDGRRMIGYVSVDRGQKTISQRGDDEKANHGK